MSWPRDDPKLSRVRALLAERELDALVVRAPDNVLYLTDYWCMKGYDLAVFPREGEPALVVLEPQAEEAERCWAGEVRLFAGYDERDPRPPTARSVEAAQAVDWTKYPKLKIFYQTTLNAEEFEDVVKAIEQRAATVDRADTICYATKENQDAARVLAHDPEIDVIVIIGGKKSANTKHLWEICREKKRSYLVQGAEDLDPAWFDGAAVVGVTAGSSTPDYVIDEVEQRIAAF